MSPIFITSDTHFGHNRKFIYEARGFHAVEEMNKELVYRWNQLVTEEDLVYHLGDTFLSDNSNIEWMGKLNDHVRLIRGNHDTDNKVRNLLERGFIESALWADVLHYQHKHFYLGHFATMTSNYTDPDKGMRGRTLDLYGHTHQKTNFWNDNPFVYHVGVDSLDLAPVLIDQVIEDMQNKMDELKIE